MEKREVYDIETLKVMFLYCGYDIDTKEWFEFEISEYCNDVYALVKHLQRENVYGVSFNGVNFDFQVLQYILDEHDKWLDLSNLEIVTKIYKFSQRVIDDTKYGLYPPYREEAFSQKQIDLFKIHHFDNENKRTSLKWLQFSMDFYNVEEMPIHHSIEKLSREDIQVIKDYCRNDVESTYEFYKYTVGDVEHSTYKGSDKIQDRLDLIEEIGFPDRAINYSDVKIGDEINKMTYKQITNNTDQSIRELRKKRKSKSFKYGDCIPSYVDFKTPEFKSFFERMKKVKVNLREKEEYPFSYNGTNYMIAKGGIHSNEKYRIITPSENELLIDADIGSQYPNAIIKRELFPSHLGRAWLVGYSRTRDRRLEYKAKSEESKKYKGLSEQYKLALNGGGFGKTNEVHSWQYDPFVQFSCTIGNQFEILMLIEMLESVGIHVVSANTDGIVCLLDKLQEKLYYEKCREWEVIVGNSEQGKLEYTYYSKLVQSSVNDYLAVKLNGKIKKKGDFMTEFDLNKNKSRRIIPIALEKYFVEGIPVEDTINGWGNIFDFCIGLKASKDYHYELVDKDGDREIYHRMVRYIVSNKGKKLFKVKNEGSDSTGSDILQAEAGDWKMTIVNKIDKNKKIEEYDINKEYYITKALDRIRSIQSGSKRKGTNTDPNQQTLF